MISEVSRDTEDWSNDAENSDLLYRNTLYFKIENNIRNCNSLRVHNINGFIFLYFDQINTALMSIIDSIKKQVQFIRFIITWYNIKTTEAFKLRSIS